MKKLFLFAAFIAMSLSLFAQENKDGGNTISFGVSPMSGIFHADYEYEGGKYKLDYTNYLSFNLGYEWQSGGSGILAELGYTYAKFDKMKIDKISNTPIYTTADAKNISDISFSLYYGYTLNRQQRWQFPIYIGVGLDALQGKPFHHLFISPAAKFRVKYYMSNNFGLYVGVNGKYGFGGYYDENKDYSRKDDTHTMYKLDGEAGLIYSF